MNNYDYISSPSIYLLLTSFSMMPSSQNLCGPFDREFNRKFRGAFTRSMSAERIKLAKVPSQKCTTGSHSNYEMLPKIKEIQKIARTDRRKPQKINKYLDGVTDLELYTANKMIKSASARQIASQISRKSTSLFEDRKIVTQNYLRISATAPSEQKYHAIAHSLSPPQNTIHEASHAGGISFARKPDRLVSDQQFIAKFDEFIVRKREEDNGIYKEKNSMKETVSPEEAEKQLTIAKERLTKIARKMIAEQHNYSEEDELVSDNIYVYHEDEHARRQPRSIDWILQECLAYEKRFKIRRERVVKR